MKKTHLTRSLVCLLAALALLLCAGLTALAEDEEVQDPGWPAWDEEAEGYREWLLPGEGFTFTIKPYSYYLDHLEVKLYSIEQDVCVYKDVENVAAGAYTIPASAFSEPGIYMIQLTAIGTGEKYTNRTRYSLLTVLSAAPAEGSYYLTVPSTVQLGNAVNASIVAPGADKIVINANADTWNWDGGYGWIRTGLDQPGTYSADATIVYPDGRMVNVPAKSFAVAQAGQIQLSVSLPETLTPGQDVTVTVPKATNADEITPNIYYSFYLMEDDFEGDYSVILEKQYQRSLDPLNDPEETELMGDGKQVTIPGSLIKAGKNYSIFAMASAPGYGSAQSERYYSIPGEAADEALKIHVAGSDTAAQVPIRSKFLTTVEIPEGATAIRLKFGHYDWEYLNYYGQWEEWKEQGLVRFGGDPFYQLFEVTSYPTFAQAYYGEVDEDTEFENLNWDGHYSNTVIVTTSSTGMLENPEFTVESTAVKQGEYLRVTITELDERADGVWVYPDDLGDNWFDSSEFEDGVGRTVLVPTAYLTPGTYRMTVESHAEGMYSGASFFVFTVEEPEEALPEVFITVGKTGTVSGEEFNLSGYAPGAERFELFYNDEQYAEEGRDRFFRRERLSNGGEYDFYALAYFPDRDEPVRSNIVHVSVSSEGSFDLTINAPSAVGKDQDLAFTVTNLETADLWYDIRVCDNTPGYGDEIARFTSDDSQPTDTFTVPAAQLISGHVYDINVYAEKYGYDGTSVNKSVLVTGDLAEAGTLTVNGKTEGLDSLESHEDFSVVITAPGATVVNFYNEGYSLHEVGEDGVVRFINSVESGDHQLYALISSDDIDFETWDWDDSSVNWTGVTNIVTVHADSQGRVQPGTVTLMDPSDPERELTGAVGRGDLLPVYVQTVDHVQGYHIRIYDQDWNEYTFSVYDRESEDFIAFLSTVRLEPDNRYFVSVWYDSEPGWDSEGTDTGFFTVAPPADGMTFRASRTVGVIHDVFGVSAYYAGADHFRVFVNDEEFWYGGQDGFLSEEFELELRFESIYCAAYDAEDNVLATSDPIAMHVTSNGTLEAPVIHVDPIIQPGQALTFTVDGLERADQWWWIELNDQTIGTRLIQWNKNEYNGETAFTMPADKLIAGHAYWINMRIEAYGKEGEGAQASVYVQGDNVSDQLTLTVNGGTTPVSVQAQQEFMIAIDAPNATLIRLWTNGWDYQDSNFLDENGHVDWGYRLDGGEYAVFVEATYDTLVDGKNWDEYNWSAASAAVRVSVSSVGRAKTGTITLDKHEVVRGEFLNVTLGAAENTSEYHLRVQEENVGERYFNSLKASDQAITVAVATSELEPGRYYVDVYYMGEQGYNGNGAQGDYFTVTEPAAGMTFLVSATEGVRHENFEVSAYYPGAAFFRFYNDDGLWGNDFWANNNGVRATYEYCNADFHFWCVAYDENGNELIESEHKHLTSYAIREIDKPVIDAPSYAVAGQDLTFTVSGLEQADWYWNVNVSDTETWNQVAFWDRNNNELASQFTVPGDLLAEGNSYQINVWLDAYGTDGANAWARVPVMAQPAQTGSISITVNGESETTEVQSATDFVITVSAPGYRRVRLWNGNEWDEDMSGRLDLDENGYLEVGYDRGGGGRYIFFAQAYDESANDWGPISNEVQVDVTSYGPIWPGELTLSAHSLARGEILTVSVPEVEHAVWYNMDVKDPDWNDVLGVDTYGMTGPFTVSIATADLAPGEYYVNAHFGAPGYDWGDTDRIEDYKFTVTESAAVTFRTETSHLYIGESLNFSLYAPGANGVRVIMTFDGDEMDRAENNNGSSMAGSLVNTWPVGAYVLTAEADYGSGWQSVGTESLTTISKGEMGQVNLTVDRIVNAGDMPTFTFTGVANTQWYKVMVADEDGGVLFNYDFEEPGTYVLDAGQASDGRQLEAGKRYWLSLGTWCPGYEAGWANAVIAVIDPSRVLVLPGALTEIDAEAFAGTGAQEVIIPSGVTVVGDRAFADSEIIAAVIPAGLDVGNAFDGDPNVVIVER
ncbi:MAG: hypothetical protein IJ157_10510 [Clostridia bacterium]|nr:hypothetical protein [Clostridia bacterium]